MNGALEMLTTCQRAVVEEQLEIRDSLLKLLHLLVDNISELSIDDSWLKGQVDGLLASITPPLTCATSTRWSAACATCWRSRAGKARSVAAQQEMRGMLSEFIDSLAAMNQSSSAFESQIEETARQIEQVSSPEELKRLIDGVISATHAMAESRRIRGAVALPAGQGRGHRGRVDPVAPWNSTTPAPWPAMTR